MKSNSKPLSNNYEKLKNNVSNLRSSSAEDRIKKLKNRKANTGTIDKILNIPK